MNKTLIAPILFGVLVGVLVYISLLQIIVWPMFLILIFHVSVACLLAYLIFSRPSHKG